MTIIISILSKFKYHLKKNKFIYSMNKITLTETIVNPPVVSNEIPGAETLDEFFGALARQGENPQDNFQLSNEVLEENMAAARHISEQMANNQNPLPLEDEIASVVQSISENINNYPAPEINWALIREENPGDENAPVREDLEQQMMEILQHQQNNLRQGENLLEEYRENIVVMQNNNEVRMRLFWKIFRGILTIWT